MQSLVLLSALYRSRQNFALSHWTITDHCSWILLITVIHFSSVIKLYKLFYKIISRNYELCKFWFIDFSSCFDFRYFRSHESESSCNASYCELTICSLPADVPWRLFVTHSFLWGRTECVTNESRRTYAWRLIIRGYFGPCSHVTYKMQGFV